MCVCFQQGLPYGYTPPPPPKLSKAQVRRRRVSPRVYATHIEYVSTRNRLRYASVLENIISMRAYKGHCVLPGVGFSGSTDTFEMSQEALIKSVMEKSKGSTKMKRVEFKSSGKAVAKVNDTDVASNATLGTYMTLPAEQVSERLEEERERERGKMCQVFGVAHSCATVPCFKWPALVRMERFGRLWGVRGVG
jgi:hypothetical protein